MSNLTQQLVPEIGSRMTCGDVKMHVVSLHSAEQPSGLTWTLIPGKNGSSCLRDYKLRLLASYTKLLFNAYIGQ